MGRGSLLLPGEVTRQVLERIVELLNGGVKVET